MSPNKIVQHYRSANTNWITFDHDFIIAWWKKNGDVDGRMVDWSFGRLVDWSTGESLTNLWYGSGSDNENLELEGFWAVQ